MNPDAVRTTCPTPDDLSAWHDGELQSVDIGEHVRACEACSAATEAYRRMDASIHAGSLPSGDLAERIKQRCREAAAESPVGLWLSSSRVTALKYAAALVIAGIAGAALVMSALREPSAGSVAKGPEEAPVQTPTTAQEQIVNDGEITLIEPKSNGTRLDPSTLRNANTSGSPAMSTTDRPRRHTIAEAVSHVWVADAAAMKALREGVEAGYPRGTWTSRDNQTILELSVGDKELQDLVDYVESSGTSLLSPAFPQPRRAEETYFTGRKIRYQAKFVPAE